MPSKKDMSKISQKNWVKFIPSPRKLQRENWSRWRGRHAFHLTNEEYPTGDYL